MEFKEEDVFVATSRPASSGMRVTLPPLTIIGVHRATNQRVELTVVPGESEWKARGRMMAELKAKVEALPG